jgi:transcriptional regulatory protein RtcR
MKRKTVVIGMLGTTLDQSRSRGDRWSAWRPSVAICQQQDFVVDRFDLLYFDRTEALLAEIESDIQSVSPETQIVSQHLAIRDPWDFEEVYAALHQFASQYEFDTDANDYRIHITTGTHVAQICLFLLTESRHLPGVLLQSSPPKRKGQDSTGYCRTIDLDLSRYDALASRFQQEHQEASSFLKSGIATRNAPFNALIDRIEQVSLATQSPILLSGPTGAGKSQLAKRIYELKRQRQHVSGPMVEVNCATIRGDAAMSTLFGHIKGAYTGATNARPGLLKTADRGLLFLDEIGELGLDEQAMLLRAIEEKSFLPVGSDSLITSDFQLIAGTNRDLIVEVAQGRFRDDLLARINLWTFQLPGLADRRDDIDPNVDYELQQYAAKHGRKVTMNKEARAHFMTFANAPTTPWKANFRDLNAAITRMSTLCTSGRITTEMVDEEIERLRKSWKEIPGRDSDEAVLQSVLKPDAIEQIDRFDRVQLAEVLRVCRSAKSLSAAGRELFSVSRLAKQSPNDADRLRKYLAKFGIQWSDIEGS